MISYTWTQRGEKGTFWSAHFSPAKLHRNKYSGPYAFATPSSSDISVCFTNFPFEVSMHIHQHEGSYLSFFPDTLKKIYYLIPLQFLQQQKWSALPSASMFSTPFYCNKNDQYLQVLSYSLPLFWIIFNIYRIAATH